MNHEPTTLTRLTTTAVQKADQKPAICMPGSIHATKATIPALITNRNKPRVAMVIGSVSTMAMGLMMELTMPSNTPPRISVDGRSIATPGTHRVAIHNPIATMAARIRNPSILPPWLRYAATLAHFKERGPLIIQARQRRILGRRRRLLGRRRRLEGCLDARQKALPGHAHAHIGFVPD